MSQGQGWQVPGSEGERSLFLLQRFYRLSSLNEKHWHLTQTPLLFLSSLFSVPYFSVEWLQRNKTLCMYGKAFILAFWLLLCIQSSPTDTHFISRHKSCPGPEETLKHVAVTALRRQINVSVSQWLNMQKISCMC